MIILNHRVAQLDAEGSALFKELLQQHRLQNGIQLLANVFQQDGQPELYGILHDARVIGLIETNHAELVVLLIVFDPFVCLALRINHQGPTTSISVSHNKV